MEDYRLLKSIFAKSRASLLELLKVKSFDLISIKEIAENAGFSRQYFYRFYKDKMDLVYDIFEYDISRSIEGIYRQGFSSVQLMDRLLEHSQMYKALFESSYYEEAYRMLINIGDVFIRSMEKSSIVKRFGKEEDDALHFYLNAVVFTFVDTIRNNKTTTSTELISLFYKNVPPALDYLKQEAVTADMILYRIEKYKGSIRLRSK